MILVAGKLFASEMYLEYSRISTMELFILFIVQIPVHSQRGAWQHGNFQLVSAHG